MEYRMVPSSGGGFKSFLVLVFFFIVFAFFATTQAGVRETASSSSFSPMTSSMCANYVVVNNGDTLSAIAQRCGVSESDLLAANPQLLNANQLVAGGTLRIPGASAYYQTNQNLEAAYTIPVTGNDTITASAGIGGGSDLTPLNNAILTVEQYTIQPGDTLGRIANAHSISLATLLSYNPGITNPDVVYPGEVIQIPRN